MDNYDQAIKRMSTMSEEERKKMNQEDRKLCNCPPCPTHLQCAVERNELLYCFEGKSGCLKEQKVCFCPDCPVHSKYELGHMYYCLRATEAEQKARKNK